MALRVGVFGVGGRMGSTVAHAVCAEPDMELVSAIDPSFEGIDIGEVTGVVGCQFPVSSDVRTLLDDRVQVMVDFTHIEAAKANLEFCAANGIHAVVGTSGFTKDDYEHICRLFDRAEGGSEGGADDAGGAVGKSGAGGANCLIAPNFAIGAVLMIRFAEMAAPYFDTAEIIELHHDGKVDAPSGTAVSTAERLASASAEWAADPTTSETVAGARGAKGPAGIPIHSVRMRGMVAHQEILMGTTGQTLSLRHDSIDRSSFMPGVVLAIRRIGEVRGLTVGLDGFLD